MKSTTFKRTILGAVVLSASAVAIPAISNWSPFVAQAHFRPPECYRIEQKGDSPIATDNAQGSSETWCYKELEEPIGARLVYNIDEQGRMQPELSVMIEADGTLRHASLLKGKLTIHRVRDFNPTGVPLTPPEGAERVIEPISPLSADAMEKNLSLFQEYGDVTVTVATMRPGTFATTVEPNAVPWRGYWFPHSSGRMHIDAKSPMAKYDRFLKRRTQVNPGAQKWEKQNHRYTGVNWAGHCNGWAAASVLQPEPKHPVADPFSGERFTVSDIKALWMERDYCPKLAFFGGRNRGRPTDNPSDISAREFHNVMTYFLGQLKKPVLMDYMATEPVENRVVSAYAMNVKQTGSNSFYVETTLKIHEYDKEPISEPGPAPFIERTYRYTIYTDDEGRVKSGSWHSANPDFLWVPLAEGNCDSTNPSVESFWIREIMRFSQEAPSTSPSPTPSPDPSATPAPEPAPAPTATPVPTPEPVPSATPEPTPAPEEPTPSPEPNPIP